MNRDTIQSALDKVEPLVEAANTKLLAIESPNDPRVYSVIREWLRRTRQYCVFELWLQDN